MTRAGLRGRLAALEAHLETQEVEVIQIWWADAEAGLWREGVGAPGEAEGQTMPISPPDLAEIRASGEHRVMLTGVPDREGRR